jgi:predicted DNA-binding WGR domain protein
MIAPEDNPTTTDADAPRLSLKEAAERTGRSVTTLRRYIRALRLRAEKTPGRFGPEYTLDLDSLRAAGFDLLPGGAHRAEPSTARAPAGLLQAPAPAHGNGTSGALEIPQVSRPLERILQDFVPADIYRELAMKHEQLLVQYGMVRSSGQRLFEFREEAEARAEDLRLTRERNKETQDRASREIGFLRQHLRQAELEIEQKNQDLSSLREKTRVLELRTRNAVMTESIEQQFLKLFQKEREVESLLIPTPPVPALLVEDAPVRLDLPLSFEPGTDLPVSDPQLPPPAGAGAPSFEASASASNETGETTPSSAAAPEQPATQDGPPEVARRPALLEDADALDNLLDLRLGRRPDGRPLDH